MGSTGRSAGSFARRAVRNSCPFSALRCPFSAFRCPFSAFRCPFSAFRCPASAFHGADRSVSPLPLCRSAALRACPASLRAVRWCVVRTPIRAHQLLLPPANWCPIFAPRTAGLQLGLLNYLGQSMLFGLTGALQPCQAKAFLFALSLRYRAGSLVSSTVRTLTKYYMCVSQLQGPAARSCSPHRRSC